MYAPAYPIGAEYVLQIKIRNVIEYADLRETLIRYGEMFSFAKRRADDTWYMKYRRNDTRVNSHEEE